MVPQGPDGNPASAESAMPAGGATPRRLLWRFAILSVVSTAVIVLLVGTGVFQFYRAQVVEHAERSAVALAQVLLVQERAVLVSEDAGGAARIAIDDAQVAGLDLRVARFLVPFGVLKIKVYDAGRRIVYSTDKSIVGRVDSANEKLARVLGTGSLDSRLVQKERIADLHGQDRFRVDVVETYLPVRDGAAIIGSFEVYVDVSRAYDDTVRTAGRSLALLLAVLVAAFGALFVPMWQGTRRLETVLARLRALAATDTLTGLFNRRHLLRRLREEYARMDRARRRREPCEFLGVVMTDVDRFKAINDRHGHAAGDAVLRQFGSRLKEVLRDYDVLGRYGGEEFLVLLPNTTLPAAQAVAERMRASIADAPFVLDGTEVAVTASFGVTCTAGDTEEASAVIARADECLYRAKNEGRNRVASGD